jgi:hypothetical protein
MNKSLAEYLTTQEADMPETIDLRGLEAPEPMEKILLACTHMTADEKYLAHLPHTPEPLFPHLEMRGLKWHVFEEPDGSALVLIQWIP